MVIGKTCRNVTPDEAWDYIEGFCPALDMGLQDFRDTDQGSMLRVKGADTLLPIGPGLVRGVNLFEQTLRTFVNGLVVQEAHIGDETIWGPHYVIADLARHITLLPGDVILMGTPCHSRSVDPGGLVARAIPFAQVIGCVVHASTSTPEPGLVLHKMGQGLIIGEPGGGRSERVAALAQVLGQAGFDVTHSEDVRYDIWYKLWGNMTMNPVSAITGATMDQVLADPLVRDFCSAAMAEAAAVGARIGCAITQSAEDRHAIIDALMGLTRLFGRVHGIYPAQA